MTYYGSYKDEWKRIIIDASIKLRLPLLLIEKDVIQSMFLSELSKSGLPLVFKGGTSLSKAYRIIDRFSEDIDLSMSRDPSVREKKLSYGLIMDIALGLGMELDNPDMVRSRHDYNAFRFSYESLFDRGKQAIIIETSFYQPSYPAEKMKIGNYLADCFKGDKNGLAIPFPGFDFSMDVQSLSRTLVDKVFAVCDYRLANMRDRDSRHLYDIYKLLPKISLDDHMRELVDRVRKDRMFSKNNPSAQPEYDIPKMLEEIIESRFYEADYNNVTSKLLYEDVSYEEAVGKGIGIISQTDIFSYRGN